MSVDEGPKEQATQQIPARVEKLGSSELREKRVDGQTGVGGT